MLIFSSLFTLIFIVVSVPHISSSGELAISTVKKWSSYNFPFCEFIIQQEHFIEYLSFVLNIFYCLPSNNLMLIHGSHQHLD